MIRSQITKIVIAETTKGEDNFDIKILIKKINDFL
jgi:hypothetical protein